MFLALLPLPLPLPYTGDSEIVGFRTLATRNPPSGTHTKVLIYPYLRTWVHLIQNTSVFGTGPYVLLIRPPIGLPVPSHLSHPSDYQWNATVSFPKGHVTCDGMQFLRHQRQRMVSNGTAQRYSFLPRGAAWYR